jgi:putative FmdB family regulatory protein
MPIYEYLCTSCGREFEEWQKFSDPAVDRCSECGGRAKRLISQSSFVLKGSGWYVTDYGKSTSCSCKSHDKPEKSASTSESSSSSSTPSCSSSSSSSSTDS